MNEIAKFALRTVPEIGFPVRPTIGKLPFFTFSPMRNPVFSIPASQAWFQPSEIAHATRI